MQPENIVEGKGIIIEMDKTVLIQSLFHEQKTEAHNNTSDNHSKELLNMLKQKHEKEEEALKDKEEILNKTKKS